MKEHSRDMVKSQVAQKFSGNHLIKELLTIEKMKQGYESMAQINLDICELGLADCLSTLLTFEDQLIGDD